MPSGRRFRESARLLQKSLNYPSSSCGWFRNRCSTPPLGPRAQPDLADRPPLRRSSHSPTVHTQTTAAASQPTMRGGFVPSYTVASLETQPRRKLEGSGGQLRRDPRQGCAETILRRVPISPGPAVVDNVSVVENIESFRPNIQLNAFGK